MKIISPLTKEIISKLKAGDEVFFTGIIYTARDQAHKRMAQALKTGKKLPLDLKNQVIYYCGPTPSPKGKVIGACGPTTSSRMDDFTLVLLKFGLKGMIGKGGRSLQVQQAIKRYQGVYFLAFAGCGALLAKYVKSKKLVAFKDLGPEAIYRLEVKDFPLIVGIDCQGKSVYYKEN
jgi:fumarate hydratase subunit beta